MMAKKAISLLIVCFLLLTGCSDSQADPSKNDVSADNNLSAATDIGQSEDVRTIVPLPDTAMENMTDAVLSVSLEEGDAYVDDNGRMQMDLTIYAYDQYDMVDIANLKVGDTIVRHNGEIKVISLEQDETGRIFINGGLDNGGFELVTDACGIFYETGYNDHKSWYPVGAATIRVSADFIGRDCADLDLGEVIIYPGDFLIGAVTNYDFTPYNTTIRIEDGQIVEMNRRYIP